MDATALRLASRIFDQPLIQNQYRSDYVEAMIEPYLSPAGWRYTGDGWSGWDFEREDGLRLELKQSAARQTWSDVRKLRTGGAFDIAARKGYFYQGGTKYTARPGRAADVYVFAWHPVFGPNTDHRDEKQWEFYVVPARLLPKGQKTVALSKIKRLANPVKVFDLLREVDTSAITP